MTNDAKQAAIQDYMRRRSVDASLKQAAIIGVAFGLAYVALTLGIKGIWQTAVEAHLNGASSLSSDDAPLSTENFVQAMRDAPPFPKLLRLLMLPMPATHSAINGGALALWPILFQGVWLGVLVFLNICMLSRQNLPKAISSIWPIFALYLVPFLFVWGLTGSLGRAIFLGFIGLIAGNVPGALVTLWVFLPNKFTPQKV